MPLLLRLTVFIMSRVFIVEAYLREAVIADNKDQAIEKVRNGGNHQFQDCSFSARPDNRGEYNPTDCR